MPTQPPKACRVVLLSQLGPESCRVIAAALIHERALGKPLTASAIRRLCEEEGASYSACLAVILGKGVSRETGRPIPLGKTGSVIAVPDDETEAALDWREEIDAS